MVLVGAGVFIVLRGLTGVETPRRYMPEQEILGVEDHEYSDRQELYRTERYRKKKDIKGGGVILIGPIPVVFGTEGKYAIIAIAMTVVLMVLVLLMMVVGWR